MKDFSKADKFIQVANDIDEARVLVESKGLLITKFLGDTYVVQRHASQYFLETDLSFFVDPINGHVWVADREFDKFTELFEDSPLSEGAVG